MRKKVAITCLLLFLVSGLWAESGQITKKVAIKDLTPGTCKKIQIGNYDRAPGNEIAIFGLSGGQFLSCQDYRSLKTYKFKKDDGRKGSWLGFAPELVDVDNDGNFEIMKSGGGYSDVGLLDSEGKLLWEFHPHPKLPPRKMIAADIDKDGAVEFYVADYTGLYRLDHKGDITWKITNEKFSDVNVIRDKRFKRPRVIGLTSGRNKGEFQIFDSEGRMVKRFSPEVQKYRFDIINWPDNESSYVLTESIGFRKCRMSVMDLDGEVIFDYQLKKFPFYHGLRGVAVKFDKEEKPYLVVSARSRAANRLTRLTIFSPSGDLIYGETLQSWGLLCVNPSKQDKNEVLLVKDGARGVWQYGLEKSSLDKR
jgi:hypothetical protein